MKMLKYNRFFEGLDNNSDNDYLEIKEELKVLIENSINTSDHDTFKDFVKSYIKNNEDTKIVGLINDSDIYEFYLKYRNDIDEILSNINFYDEVPSDINIFSIYDYIIKGTERAIIEVVNMIYEDLKK